MGTRWVKSGSVEFDGSGDVADGALAYFFAGGTTTPISVYQDAAETTPHTHPVVASASGRWPLVFIPYRASFDEKITTETGTQLTYYQNIPNPDPVEAASDTVGDDEIFATGDWKFRTTTGALTGYVRANGRTIGSAASGATERANADTEDLFTFLWNGHANGILAVSTGRGGSAAADFAANKTIALPDCRSASPMGVDDMGNSALGAGYGGTFTTGDATTGGSVGGANTHTLTSGQIPSHTHTFSVTSGSGGAHTHVISIGDPGHGHGYEVPGNKTGPEGATPSNRWGGGTAAGTSGAATTGITAAADTASAHTHSVSGTTAANSGGDGAHNNMSRHVLGTWYIKL